MKKAAVGCLALSLFLGVLAAVVLWPYLSWGGGNTAQWDGRDFDAELEQLTLEASGLDQPGAVNGYPAFERAIAAFGSMQNDIGRGDPQMAAREIAGLSRERHFDAEFAEVGKRWLESETLTQIDDALTEAARADGFAGPESASLDPASGIRDMGGQARGLARLLSARVIVAVHQGEFDAAAANVDHLVTVSLPFAQHPTIIGRLMGLAVAGLAMTETRRVALATDDAEVLERLERSLDRAATMPDLRFVLEGERLVGLAQLMDLPRPSLPIKMADPTAQADALEEFYDRAEEWAAKPEAERKGATPGEWADSLSEANYSMVKMLLPAIDRFMEADRMFALPEAGTRLVLAIRRYTIEEGALPSDLALLVPEFMDSVPGDPFNEAGFVYKPEPDPHTGAAFTLYSVGADGMDNGGLPPPEGEASAMTANGEGYDENFTAE